MNRKYIYMVLILLLFSGFYIHAIPRDVKPETFVGTWLAEEEVEGEIVERIWVVKESGKMTTYRPDGEKDYEFHWEKYTENVYLFKIQGSYLMYNIYYIEEGHLRLRNYEDVTNEVDLYRVSEKQEGFPENIDEI